jgi:hypothetical protein
MDLDRMIAAADPSQKGMLTFDKFVILMMEEGRTQHLKDSKKRLEEWTKAFNLFEIKVFLDPIGRKGEREGWRER